jgi:hypothetical protein
MRAWTSASIFSGHPKPHRFEKSGFLNKSAVNHPGQTTDAKPKT